MAIFHEDVSQHPYQLPTPLSARVHKSWATGRLSFESWRLISVVPQHANASCYPSGA